MSSSHHFHSSTPGRPLKKNIISAGDHFSPELLLRWYGLVEFYTAAKLTYQSDKLVAIGGMAYETQLSIVQEAKNAARKLWPGPLENMSQCRGRCTSLRRAVGRNQTIHLVCGSATSIAACFGDRWMLPKHARPNIIRYKRHRRNTQHHHYGLGLL